MTKTKICIVCKSKKDICNFKIRNDTGKHNNKCRDCVKNQMKDYYRKNKIKLNKEHREWREKNKKSYEEYQEKYREANRDYAKEYSKKYVKNNKNKICNKAKKYYKKNKRQIIEQHKKYIKNKLKIDSQFKIARNLRARLYSSIKEKTKCVSAVKDLGCSIKELKIYLERQFQDGMIWENYGEWHIDHIKPLASFDLTDRGQFLKACHYTNLQPLWAKDNILKGAK